MEENGAEREGNPEPPAGCGETFPPTESKTARDGLDIF